MTAENIPIGTKLYAQYYDRIAIITITSKLQKIENMKGMRVYASSWKYQISASNLTPCGEVDENGTFTRSGLTNILKMFQVLYTSKNGWNKRIQRQALAVVLESNGNLIL